MNRSLAALAALVVLGLGCDVDAGGAARVRIQNDFANPELGAQPPWTICESSYLGVPFGAIAVGATSDEREVAPGLDYVLMVAAWDDPTCAPEHSVPLASRYEEEVVDGQRRTLAINLPNHQGPCPPEGVQPIPAALYDRILALWPDLGFEPYERRAENPQCQ